MRPSEHFSKAWDRCAELATVESYLAKHLSAVLTTGELLRAEWVARLSSLDLYVHELVAQGMLGIFEGRLSETEAFRRFQLSNQTVTRIRNAVTASEASAAFDLEVRGRLSISTYQAPEKIADGIRLISDIELWNEVAILRGASPKNKKDVAKSLKKELAAVVDRRNKIAHEGDLQPALPREAWPIDVSQLDEVRQIIESLVKDFKFLLE